MTSVASDITERTRAAATAMYEAVATGKLETFMSFISPSIVVEEPRFLPYGGSHTGIDGLQRLLGEISQRFDLSGYEVDDIIVDGQQVCAFGRVPTAGRTGTVVFVEHAIFEDDKVVKFGIYMQDIGDLLEGKT